MSLGELIEALEAVDPKLVCRKGFRNPHSYRGYYEQLAFEPAANVPVGEMLACARSAVNATYQGWKGGDYTMMMHTDCWIDVRGTGNGELIGPMLLGYILTDTVEPPPLPEEPPPLVVVLDCDGRAWQRTGGYRGEWACTHDDEGTDWESLNHDHNPLTRLIPDPFAEPVELPWTCTAGDIKELTVKVVRDQVFISATDDGERTVIPVPARAMARALMTAAADAAEKEQS